MTLEFSELEESLDFIYGHNEFYQETFFDVWSHCIAPSVMSIFHTLAKIILVNTCFNVIVSTGRITSTGFHFFSGLSGIFFISGLQSTSGKVFILIFFTQAYFLLHLGHLIQSKYDPPVQEYNTRIQYLSSSNIIKYYLIAVLVLCEYFLLEEETWMEIRGVIMVFTMKLISLAENIQEGTTSFPTFWSYFGYIFCGANIMFGPWITFQEYIFMYHHPPQKTIWWFYGVLRGLFLSIFFLMISNCWANFFITDDANRWLVAYKEALSFRTSHYFICYFSEVSMLAAGYKNQKIWYDDREWRFFITDPVAIEFPTALVNVVKNWNRPMHEFLKKYFYRSWLPLGKFYAVLVTYIASSFLHGFEIKVSVVLITIGVFSYLQFSVRDHLSRAFNCCLRVHICKDECTHKYKRNSLRCRIGLIIFSCLTVLHLIYLGVLMDPSTNEVGIYEKWNSLHFTSFWIMLVNTLMIL